MPATTHPFPTPGGPRAKARTLYWSGVGVPQIAEQLDVPLATVKGWRLSGKWDKSAPIERIDAAIEARIVWLAQMDGKEGRHYKEFDFLMRQQERLARIHRFAETGNHRDINKKIDAAQNRRSAARNHFEQPQVEALRSAFAESLFGYQRGWYEAGLVQRIRNILKSRQIGATWYFAREALTDAAENGRNKIFLSASKAQASIFRSYIRQFAKAVCDVELTGDPIILSNGAELHFLGTNSNTAQGYHGDTYLDEYFWIHRFAKFKKVTSGMAMHAKWRQTYFSTPSTLAHEAFPFWSGAAWNARRPKAERAEFSTDHDALRSGAVCPDGQWRQIVTVEDAIAGGCDLFDIDRLRLEYSPEEFANLLMCQFLDDTLSAFGMDLLQGCAVDSWDAWEDVRPFAPRPVGDSPVWIGYDPSGDGDDGDGAGLVIDLPPDKPTGKHRFLERHRLRGRDYQEQAEFVLSFLDKYKVEHIGIDETGIGDAVAKIVSQRFPMVTRYRYHPVLKSNMVMQAQHIMRRGRLEFDAGWSDLMQSFLAIRRTNTESGGSTTYTAGRNAATGHADLAWAGMHALFREPIESVASPSGRGPILEIFE
jgi:uncharacterized protein YjcR